MKFPVEVTIKNRYYKIEYVNTLREVSENFEVANWVGTCGHELIRILATQPRSEVLDTLIRELLRAVTYRNKMLEAAVKEELKEPFFDALATELTLVLLGNGWIQRPKHDPPITKRVSI